MVPRKEIGVHHPDWMKLQARDDQPNTASATVDCTSIAYLARCVSGTTSVGLNAVAFVTPR
jgi:hypothetical protein